MSTTPPPPSRLSPPPPDSSSSSHHLHQQTIRHQERLQRDLGSPELRRVPSTSTLLPPPLPPLSTPVTFNGQSFSHLPSHIVASMRNLQPFPTSSRTWHNANPPISMVQSNVSFTF